MNATKFNPESQIVPCEPDPTDPDAPVAYVCGIPVPATDDQQPTTEEPA